MKRIPNVLASSLENLYLVGGAVRDLMLGLEPKEYDLITTTPLEKISLKTFVESNNGQTVGVYLKGKKYDISYYSSLMEDLERRDFTINSMALPVKKDGMLSAEELVDPCGGLNDLKAGILKSFKPHESFLSDPVRVVRGLRFISEYNFNVEHDTMQAMKNVVESINKKTARERIFPPLKKFIEGPYFRKGAKVALEINFDKFFSIPLENASMIASLKPYCRWPALFRKKRACFNKFVDEVFPPKRLIRWTNRLVGFLEELEWTKFEWTVKITESEVECLISILKLFNLNSDLVERYMHLKLAVTPQDIISIGAKGREISMIMIEVWKKVLTSKVSNKRNNLLKLARETLKSLQSKHTAMKHR